MKRDTHVSRPRCEGTQAPWPRTAELRCTFGPAQHTSSSRQSLRSAIESRTGTYCASSRSAPGSSSPRPARRSPCPPSSSSSPSAPPPLLLRCRDPVVPPVLFPVIHASGGHCAKLPGQSVYFHLNTVAISQTASAARAARHATSRHPATPRTATRRTRPAHEARRARGVRGGVPSGAGTPLCSQPLPPHPDAPARPPGPLPRNRRMSPPPPRRSHPPRCPRCPESCRGRACAAAPFPRAPRQATAARSYARAPGSLRGRGNDPSNARGGGRPRVWCAPRRRLCLRETAPATRRAENGACGRGGV